MKKPLKPTVSNTKPSDRTKKSIIATAATLAGVGAVYAFGALLKKFNK